MTELDRIRESSQYLATLLRRDDTVVEWLQDERNLYKKYPLTGLYQDLLHMVRDAGSFRQLMQLFRIFKQRHFLRIGGRDLLGMASLAETTSQLSDLACVTLQAGFELLWDRPEWWAARADAQVWLRVRDDYRIVVMGLGKLGAHELNYVSDVDLLYMYSRVKFDAPESYGVVMLLNQICLGLTRLMADTVEGDRIFYVDLRLRPQGKDGTLVPSISAASNHYLNSGRAWERQVLLKARPVAGDRSLGMAFVREMRPFVFRRFLDFQALDELQAMRDRILKEAVQPRSRWQEFDVKLGLGGIREVEFLVQSLQLIYGGRHPELDEPNTLRCLDRLADLGLMAQDVASELKEHYVFLRRVEHWVQLDQNRQTQRLPRSEDAMARLSLAMGFERDRAKFLKKLEDCCGSVHRHFLDLFQPEEKPQGTGGGATDEPAETEIEAPGVLECFSEELLSRLRSHVESLPPIPRQRIFDVLRQYDCIKEADISEKVLLRLERYFNQVLRRPGFFRVFHSSDTWMGDFCKGLAASEFLSDLLSHHPGLVEGLATSGGGFADAETWERSGARLLEKSSEYEEGLEWLRRLKNERLLQIALADLRGDFDYGAIELQLSALADFVIRRTYERIRENLAIGEDLPLSVLALGKLGSREMSYLSDLDLVFVYRPRREDPGERIPAEVVRLVQRFMRMLSTPLQDGPGYAVDARLRPTGNYGPLIVTRDAWEEYYSSQADIWEIQALLRLRSVAGDADLGGWIEEKARQICYQRREPNAVWPRLCHLRQRMQRERAEEGPEQIDIKLGLGGLADLEFLVQGNLLLRGFDEPSLRNGSVRGALEGVLKGAPHLEEHHKALTTSFSVLRALDHRLRLHTNMTAARVTPRQFDSLKAVGLWPPRRDGATAENWEDVLRLRRTVRASFKSVCPDI